MRESRLLLSDTEREELIATGRCTSRLWLPSADPDILDWHDRGNGLWRPRMASGLHGRSEGSPWGAPGDRAYVAQRWQAGVRGSDGRYAAVSSVAVFDDVEFRAAPQPPLEPWIAWEPTWMMPVQAARIWAEVESVVVERTEDDAVRWVFAGTFRLLSTTGRPEAS